MQKVGSAADGREERCYGMYPFLAYLLQFVRICTLDTSRCKTNRICTEAVTSAVTPDLKVCMARLWSHPNPPIFRLNTSGGT